MSYVLIPAPAGYISTWVNPEHVIMVQSDGETGSIVVVDAVTQAAKFNSTMPPEQLINLLAGVE